jgi:hypothetical protein
MPRALKREARRLRRRGSAAASSDDDAACLFYFSRHAATPLALFAYLRLAMLLMFCHARGAFISMPAARCASRLMQIRYGAPLTAFRRVFAQTCRRPRFSILRVAWFARHTRFDL